MNDLSLHTLNVVMVSNDRRTYIARMDETNAAWFRRAVHDAVEITTGVVAAPVSWRACKAFRAIGYKVTAPIILHYDWPGQKPFRAQVVTAAVLTVEPRVFVLNTMGTGKTRAVLYAFDYLKRTGQARRLLVVAPLSTLNPTWASEIIRFFPHLSYTVVHGPSRNARTKRLRQNVDVYIINHDGMKVVADELVGMFTEEDIVCFDEVSVFRNPKTDRHKTAVRVSKPFGRVYGLTGTPMPNAPTDVYGIVKLITPNNPKLPKSFFAMRDMLMRKVSMFKWAPKPGVVDKVYEMMQPGVRFTLDECIDIPPVVYTAAECTLSGTHKKVYDDINKRSYAAWEGGQLTVESEGVARIRLLQVASGVFVTDDETVEVDLPSPRVKALMDIMDQTDRNVVVFVPFKALAEPLAMRLASPDLKTHVITGATSMKDRNATFDMFMNNPRRQAIVATPATMSHGLTLTTANLIVWYGPADNFEVYDQANARVIRPGQTASKVVIARIVSTPLERAIYKRLGQKESTQGVLLELYEEGR